MGMLYSVISGPEFPCTLQDYASQSAPQPADVATAHCNAHGHAHSHGTSTCPQSERQDYLRTLHTYTHCEVLFSA